MQTAICPGSFDPITLGHLDVIRRASKMFERVVVCVVANPGKHCAITLEERCEQVRRVTASIPNVEVDMWEGLLVDYADRYENPVVVRGLRARVSAARQALMRVATRSAEWNYLFGAVLFRLGEVEKAVLYFGIATRQQPGNSQYQTAYESAEAMRARNRRTRFFWRGER